MNFGGDFWVEFFGPFSLEKIGGEKIHPKIHSKIQVGIWEFRGQNPHCKDLALTVYVVTWGPASAAFQCNMPRGVTATRLVRVTCAMVHRRGNLGFYAVNIGAGGLQKFGAEFYHPNKENYQINSEKKMFRHGNRLPISK